LNGDSLIADELEKADLHRASLGCVLDLVHLHICIGVEHDSRLQVIQNVLGNFNLVSGVNATLCLDNLNNHFTFRERGSLASDHFVELA